MSRDFKCPVKSGPYPGGIEILEVSGWDRRVKGEIPRACVEALGIDCSAMDRRDHRGEPLGAVWFTEAQSVKLHAHKHWRDVHSVAPPPFSAVGL
jgi:hypothetical protein